MGYGVVAGEIRIRAVHVALALRLPARSRSPRPDPASSGFEAHPSYGQQTYGADLSWSY
jgi:hypothetical protein